MRLSLSTAVSPGTELDALFAACLARGLDGVELEIENGEDAASVVARARASGARLVALRARRPRSLGAMARAAADLGVPLSVPSSVAAALSASSLGELARGLADTKGSLLLGFGTDLAEILALSARIGELGSPPWLGLAWDLRPSVEDLRASSSAVLLAAHEHLRLVRLHGGGPEQRDQDGRGVGPLFVDLALSDYGGPIVLTPSAPSEIPRWRDWLSSRKIAGCGSKAAAEHEVDVRDVEPKDRLGTILGAFSALPQGATLRITLDHDPSCMVYALEETQPAGSFAFRKVSDGPEIWGAEITKTRPGAGT